MRLELGRGGWASQLCRALYAAFLIAAFTLRTGSAQAQTQPERPPAANAPAAPAASPAPALVARGLERPPRARSDEPRPYTGLVMITDGIALGLGLVGFATAIVCVSSVLSEHSDDSAACPLAIGMLGLGAGSYVLAAPIIHVARGRPGAALLSFGLRVALPGLGLVFAEASDADGLAAGVFLAGLAAAIAVDWLVLTRPAPRDELQWSLVPLDRGAALGLRKGF